MTRVWSRVIKWKQVLCKSKVQYAGYITLFCILIKILYGSMYKINEGNQDSFKNCTQKEENSCKGEVSH